MYMYDGSLVRNGILINPPFGVYHTSCSYTQAIQSCKQYTATTIVGSLVTLQCNGQSPLIDS